MQDVNLKGGKDFNARQQAFVAFEQKYGKGENLRNVSVPTSALVVAEKILT